MAEMIPAAVEATKAAWEIITQVAQLFVNTVSQEFKAGNAVPEDITKTWQNLKWENTGKVDGVQVYRFFAKNRFWPTDDEIKVHVSYGYGDVHNENDEYLGSYMRDLTLDAELVTEAAPSSITISGNFGDPYMVEGGTVAKVDGRIHPPIYTYMKQQYGGGKGKSFSIDAKGNVT
jgi:hypothetical protein